MLETACAAIRRVGARGVVTTGAIDPATLATGEDIFAARNLNHDQVMPSAQAVITHCGLGTVHRALILGVPVLCQPIGRDQPDVAARVVAAGAGLRVGAKGSPRRVAHSLQRLLATPSYAAQARSAGARLAASAQPQRYVSELEALATSRTPPVPDRPHASFVPTGPPNRRRSGVGSHRQDS